jgi:hypothetical protein
MVSGFTDSHTGTNCLNDTGSFVAECYRQICGQITCDDVVVGVADTGGGHLYLNFVLLGWVKFDLFNADGFARGVENCGMCFHG